MGKRKTEKTASLWLSVILITLYACSSGGDIALFPQCQLWQRMLYPFFHANPLHLALNIISLLSLMFLYNISLQRLLLAYLVAISIPVATLGISAHVIGLSGIIYCLLGSISFQVAQTIYFQVCIALTLLFSTLFPSLATSVHLYCYIFGVAIALLNKPFKRRC